jgi:hypothetical protein
VNADLHIFRSGSLEDHGGLQLQRQINELSDNMAAVMDDRISPREFGRLESEVAALTELVKAQTVAMQAMKTQLDTMNQTLTEARGGWRMLMIVGGGMASLGAALAYIFTHTISVTPKP